MHLDPNVRIFYITVLLHTQWHNCSKNTLGKLLHCLIPFPNYKVSLIKIVSFNCLIENIASFTDCSGQ